MMGPGRSGPKEELVGSQQYLAVLLPERELAIVMSVGGVAKKGAAEGQFLRSGVSTDRQAKDSRDPLSR